MTEKGVDVQTNLKRLCPFCHYDREHEDTMTDDGRYKVWLTKITPMPAIDLMTGEKEKTADPPFYALMLDGEGDGEDILPINFCPMCGRKLEGKNMTEKDLEIQQLRAELKRYKDAEKGGRLVFLNGATISDLKKDRSSSEDMLEDLKVSSYTTGFINGFGEGQLSILEKLML